LEPDPNLISQLAENLKGWDMARSCEIVCCTLATLNDDERFDTILYIDVLEHIEDDAGELKRASERLRRGGRIVVLSPAHQWLFTPFDSAIGHFRRYSKASLGAASPPGMELEAMFYLDACGILASAANQLLLRQSMPTAAQLGVWDKWIVPASRVLDPILVGSLGKSIIGVWRKPL
jgi:hypothetical protein